MNLTAYQIDTETPEQFSFTSVGKNGAIPKLIVFAPTAMKDLYNLILGDVIENGISDTSISDNGDTEKILATVAQSVLSFTENYKDAHIYAKGSTASRTRLYRIGLNKYFDEINLYFDIFGFKNGEWHFFEKNADYEAFLVQRK